MICGGSQAWLKASDSRSDPEGVPGFESQPPHFSRKGFGGYKSGFQTLNTGP